MPIAERTLSTEEVRELADEVQYGGWLNFTNLGNKRAVAAELRRRGVRTFSRTAHGSLLDPRYTVESRLLPDRGLANDCSHFTPRLYVLDVQKLVVE